MPATESRVAVPVEALSNSKRAAQYVRMSTDHQRYSTDNQADKIAEYAAARNFVIVRTYADEGRSGLNIAGRDALRRLIDDVQSGSADFEAIWSTTSVAGAGFRTPTKAPITNSSAVNAASTYITAASSLRTTAASPPT